jgi:hypothetical protein
MLFFYLMDLGYRSPAKKVTSYGLNGVGFHSWQRQQFFSSSSNPEEERQRWHNLEFCADILSTKIITTKSLCAFTFSALFKDAVNSRDYIGWVVGEEMSVEQCWNDHDRARPKDSIKKLPHCHFFHQKTTKGLAWN